MGRKRIELITALAALFFAGLAFILAGLQAPKADFASQWRPLNNDCSRFNTTAPQYGYPYAGLQYPYVETELVQVFQVTADGNIQGLQPGERSAVYRTYPVEETLKEEFRRTSPVGQFIQLVKLYKDDPATHTALLTDYACYRTFFVDPSCLSPYQITIDLGESIRSVRLQCIQSLQMAGASRDDVILMGYEEWDVNDVYGPATPTPDPPTPTPTATPNPGITATVAPTPTPTKQPTSTSTPTSSTTQSSTKTTPTPKPATIKPSIAPTSNTNSTAQSILSRLRGDTSSSSQSSTSTTNNQNSSLSSNNTLSNTDSSDQTNTTSSETSSNDSQPAPNLDDVSTTEEDTDITSQEESAAPNKWIIGGAALLILILGFVAYKVFIANREE